MVYFKKFFGCGLDWRIVLYKNREIVEGVMGVMLIGVLVVGIRVFSGRMLWREN